MVGATLSGRKYKAYPEYKDSGVDWFDKIPSHWRVAGFKKHIASIVDYRGKTPLKTDDGVLLVTARNIKNGKLDYNLSQEYIASDDYDDVMSRGKPEIGHVLFTTEAPLGEVANIDRTDIALAQRIIKFDGLENELNNYYLKYLIISKEFQQSLNLFASGSTVKGIKAERFVYLRNLLPSYEEQQTIANFLDHETAKIDTLIAKQEKLIELLKEKRQAVISHSVTKGLNPDTPMQDSGVVWLGEVPAHWSVSKLKYLVNEPLLYGANEAALDADKSQPRFVRITDVHSDGSLRNETFRSLPIDVALPYMLSDGDILLARSGGTVGKSFLYRNSWGKCCFAGYLIKASIDENKISADWVYLNTLTNFYWDWIKSTQIQATIQNVSAEKYNSFSVAVPPKEEVQSILLYLEEQIKRFDNLTEKSLLAVGLIKERKKALISAAVTGKIDVRDWQGDY
tara:strand:+ start:14816 stop:16177 length:1362 start_codon:yes stop_codon:yes gene_type:complete